MLHVFHSSRMLQYQIDSTSLNGATMTHVASVDTDDLDEAYRLTNHIDSDWRTNPGVIALKGAQRSTSAGDLIVQGTPGARDSKHMLVDSVGFKELSLEEVCSLTFCLPN